MLFNDDEWIIVILSRVRDLLELNYVYVAATRLIHQQRMDILRDFVGRRREWPISSVMKETFQLIGIVF